MNKLFILAFAACVCLAVGHPVEEENQDSIVTPQDLPYVIAKVFPFDRELQYLTGKRAIYGDYCLAAREDALKYLKEVASNASTTVFSAVANILDVERALKKATTVADEQTALIREDFRNAPSGVMKFLSALLWSSIEAAKENVEQVKYNIKDQDFIDGFNDVCNHLSSKLRSSLSSRFKSYVNELKKRSDIDENDEVLKITWERAGCLTTTRASMLFSACGMGGAVGSHLSNFLRPY